MKTETILNTLILSLSVSTVLITLISYLIYKMKQFPKSTKETKEATKKEGTFFRRYIPGEIITQEEISELIVPKKSKFSRYNTLPYYFALLAGVIFTSLFFKDFFTGAVENWKRSTQIDKIHQLRDQQLLKLYDLEIGKTAFTINETIPENFRHFVKEKANSLRNNKIIILSWANNKKLNATHLDNSLEGWSAFLSRYQIPFETLDTITDMSADIYIVPQAISMSAIQKTYLESLMKEGKGILFTGPCGIVDGTGEKVAKSWCEEKLQIRFIPQETVGASNPTLFSDRRNPGWMIPPGFLMYWVPEDESYMATSDDELKISAYEATFNGKIFRKNDAFSVRSLFRPFGNSKIGWLALEPHGIGGKTEQEIFYGESALIDSLSWIGKNPHVELSNWKAGYDHAMVISVDSESEIEGSYEIWKILNATKTPGTFFVVSDQLKNDDRLTKIKSPFFDLGSHSLDHSIMTGKKIDFQFNNIQDSRLALEEKFGRPVKGFHPPEERFNEDTINVSIQNRFDYFVGDQRFFRMGPLFLNLDLVYVPRVFKDDVLIKKNRALVSNEEVISALNEDLDEARLFGGLYYFNTHSQIFGKGYYLDVLKEFLSQKYKGNLWKTTFRELTTWWKDRSRLKIDIRPEKVIVRTTGKEEIKDVVLFISGKPHKMTVPAGEKGVEVKL